MDTEISKEFMEMLTLNIRSVLGLMDRVSPFHGEDPGSIPGERIFQIFDCQFKNIVI